MKKKTIPARKLSKEKIFIAIEKFYVVTGSQKNQEKLCRNRKRYVATKIKLNSSQKTKLFRDMSQLYCDIKN